MVPTPDRRHRREARRLHRTECRGRRHRALLRQTARPAGAGCIEFPQRGHPQHLRSPRLHGVGRIVSGLRRGRHAVHPHHIYILYRRSPGLQDAAAQGTGRCRPCRHGRLPTVRQERHPRLRKFRLGTGVLPRGPRPVQRPPRPLPDGPHADGPLLGQGPAAGGPLLRLHPAARHRLHEGTGDRVPQAGHPRQDPPQRSGPQPV